MHNMLLVIRLQCVKLYVQFEMMHEIRGQLMNAHWLYYYIKKKKFQSDIFLIANNKNIMSLPGEHKRMCFATSSEGS